MAHVDAVIEGRVADWLAANRGELNRRFERARARYHRLSPEAATDGLSRALAPLAEMQGEARAVEACYSAVYDLVLMHAARGTLEASRGLRTLLFHTLPGLKGILAQRPAALVAALSNAVENLGEQGEAFAQALAAIAPQLTDATSVLDAGALIAWRLGEARLRHGALDAASRLPPRTVLTVWDVTDWPDEAAPVLIAGLRAQAWHAPRHLLQPATAQSLRGAPKPEVDDLAARVARLPATDSPDWAVAGTIGDFAGFGGSFDSPPRVLSVVGDHEFAVQVEDKRFRLHADVFGSVCIRHLEPEAEPEPDPEGVKLHDATSSARRGPVRAFLPRDTHRVRIAVLRREPL